MDFLTRYSGHPLNFGSWIMFSLPDVVLNLLVLWLVLQLYFLRPSVRDITASLASLASWLSRGCRRTASQGKSESGVTEMLREKYRELGPITFHEVSTLVLFTLLVLIWFFRAPGFMAGWASVETTVSISSATPTLAIVILLFIIPARPVSQPAGPSLLVWEDVQRKFPWGIILLMGGGFALAEGARVSCLSNLIGKNYVSCNDNKMSSS